MCPIVRKICNEPVPRAFHSLIIGKGLKSNKTKMFRKALHFPSTQPPSFLGEKSIDWKLELCRLSDMRKLVVCVSARVNVCNNKPKQINSLDRIYKHRHRSLNLIWTAIKARSSMRSFERSDRDERRKMMMWESFESFFLFFLPAASSFPSTVSISTCSTHTRQRAEPNTIKVKTSL